MKIRRMCFAGIKRDDDALMFEVDFYVADSINFHERSAEFSHAFVAIFALGCDLDRFQNRVICPFGIERIGWVGIVWSRRIHRFSLSNVGRWLRGRLARDWLEHAPDVFGKYFLAVGVWMNAVRQI